MIVKSQLIEQLAKKHATLTVPEIADMVQRMLTTMETTLCQGNRIEIRNFGSFSIRYHAVRRARNPKTGEKLMAKPRRGIHFKPGKWMRERINHARQQGVVIQIKEKNTLEQKE